MLKNEQTDEELMTQYQEGSEDAFEALYSRHSGKIYGFLKARTNTSQETADLFQEVFVKIHRSKHLYNRSFPLLPWIFSVTHSVLVDGKRSSARKNEELGRDFDELASESHQEDGRLATITPLISKLPENQNVALQMRYVDEKTFEEIAATLKTSPVNVRQIISRGIKNLKRLLDEGEKR